MEDNNNNNTNKQNKSEENSIVNITTDTLDMTDMNKEGDNEEKLSEKYKIENEEDNDNYSLDIDSTELTPDYIERRIENSKKGDDFDEKNKGDIRIIYQNINSLRPPTLDKWRSTLDRIEFLNADIVGLCKTSVNWNNNKTCQIYSNILNNKFKKSTIVFSNIPKFNKYQNTYLPGGTLSMTVNDIIDKSVSAIDDKNYMGRWTGNTYQLGKGKKLNIITAYRVTLSQQVTSKKAITTNAQQVEVLRDRNLQQVKPRQQFIYDFIEQFSEMFADENNYNLLMIDANENIENPEKEGITKLINSLNLVNIYQKIHLDYTNFPTYNNGSKTIDYILGSRNIIEYITKVGYLKFHECFDSDHRGMFCDLSNDICNQSNSTRNDTSNKIRLVGSNTSNKEGEAYIRYVYKYLLYHNIFQKTEVLKESVKYKTESSDSLIKKINTIDILITEVRLKSEKVNCRLKDNNTLWTPELLQSNLRIQYWNISLKSKNKE